MSMRANAKESGRMTTFRALFAALMVVASFGFAIAKLPPLPPMDDAAKAAAEEKKAKDAAAAAVLVLAIGSAVIFAALLVHNWDTVLAEGPRIRRQVFLGLPLLLSVGLLLRSNPRPLYQDVLAFAMSLALLSVLTMRSTSSVFSAMSLGLLVLAGAAALNRQRAWRGQKKRPSGTENAAGPSAVRSPRP